ncbi:hypothetical protein CDAR_77241 [Caerostris darwini]|uniref:Uncharacterized protein n=1 Tax=Caerostris darwini TaxID=1538125 RepID=A0AAV4TSN4_9ARAC|nr:hypothetical protein CDAR_77241 [Caerostris darwini]
MNAHSTRWDSGDMNATGKETDDLLNSSLLDLIYDVSDPPTYVHYNGSGSTPDLLCVSTDLCPFTNRIVIGDPGSGYTQIIASIVIQRQKTKPYYSQRKSWNFKKADWVNFRRLTEEKLHMNNFDFSLHPSRIVSQINRAILACAKNSIPRGRVKAYKCFWSEKLDEIKAKRDRLRRKAE